MSVDVQYYKVRPNTIFYVGMEIYSPNFDYWVTAEIYNGKTADGRNFSDCCFPATQETHSFGPPA